MSVHAQLDERRLCVWVGAHRIVLAQYVAAPLRHRVEVEQQQPRQHFPLAVLKPVNEQQLVGDVADGAGRALDTIRCGGRKGTRLPTTNSCIMRQNRIQKMQKSKMQKSKIEKDGLEVPVVDLIASALPRI